MAFIRGTFLILSLFYLRHLTEGTLPNNNSKKTNGIFARNRNMPGNVDSGSKSKDLLPLVINTWNVTKAADGAWRALVEDGYDSVDALVHGCSLCEDGSCLHSIGMGGSPDENGETTLDAMIMDGKTMNVGSVGCLRNIEHAIKVAHAVLKYTKHTLLVGDQATDFALSIGFTNKSLKTNSSLESWEEWKNNSCQPNFWQNVTPDPSTHCGPYSPNESLDRSHLKQSHNKGQPASYNLQVNKNCHDTIGMVVIDENEDVAAGTTTNGACHKIPGRVGDSPIVGAGAYAQNGIGGAAATGDGDIMMRFLPSFHAVQLMSQGDHPTTAAQKAVSLISSFFPGVVAGLIAVNVHGEHGGACVGMETFHYNYIDDSSAAIVTVPVNCQS